MKLFTCLYLWIGIVIGLIFVNIESRHLKHKYILPALKLPIKSLSELSESKGKYCRVYFVAPVWENWSHNIFGKRKAIVVCTSKIKKPEPAKINDFYAKIG